MEKILTFGKYKGKIIEDVWKEDSKYIYWLASLSPKSSKISKEIIEQARRLRDERDYAIRRFIGGIHGKATEYFIECEGDEWLWTPEPQITYGLAGIYYSLDEALEAIKKMAIDENGYASIDPEDPALFVWEVLPSGHKKIVWAYWGWHHSYEGILEQGKLPGFENSLYSMAMEDF